MEQHTFKPPKIPIGIRLDYDLWALLQSLKKETKHSQIYLIENALRQTYVNQPEEQQPA